MNGRAGAIVAPLEAPGLSETPPLFVQVYRRIRGAIVAGGLGPGERLPSARTLAADLSVSRTTIESAYAQLRAEGFLIRRVGSGTFVASCLPEKPRVPRRLRAFTEPEAAAGSNARGSNARGSNARGSNARGAALSGRGRALVEAGRATMPGPQIVFSACSPALDQFPVRTWKRVLDRRLRRVGAAALAQGDPAGYRPLREAIAGYVATARAVRCDWRQVIILASTQQALDLATRLLLDPGDAAWLEEPGYLGARAALAAGGARVVPVPVDEEGIDVAAGDARAPMARLAYITPSHQFPLGATLSLARRLALLRWARERDAWIFEDDYDSEFRYGGRPLAALQGIDGGERVLYGATFNKVLFPSLRLAYLIVPESLVDGFAAARAATDGGPPTFSQAVLADFIADGHFAAHIRRMRQLYRERRDALLHAAVELEGRLTIGPADTGLHVVGWLPEGSDDAGVARRARGLDLHTPPLSLYYLGTPARPGLVLSYGGEPPERIHNGVRLLGRAL